jgi:hypothetical protein
MLSAMIIYSCERRGRATSPLILVIFALLPFLFSCMQMRKKSVLDMRMDSAVEQTHSGINNPQDSLIQKPDSLTSPGRLRPAYLGYAYPPKLVRSEARVFYAHVTVRDEAVLLREDLKTTVADEEGAKAAEDTIVIYPRDISFYRSIHLSLSDPSGDFQITPIHASDTQVIQNQRGNRWQWSIVTQTDKPTATLLLKAEGISSEGASESLEARVIPIQINIKSYIMRGFFNYLTDHPAVSIPILVSFLTFIGWLIKFFLAKKKPA